MELFVRHAPPQRPPLADRLRVMATSSDKSTPLSRRLHSVTNVDQNIKAARQKALDHQNLIEKLAQPLNTVSEKLAKLGQEQASVSAAAERRIESLTDGLEKKIEKLKEDTKAKIEQAKIDAKAKIESLQNEQHSSENALMLEYAEAIVQFSFDGSNADLATVLGVSQKEAKDLIASSTAELEKAGVPVVRPANSTSATDSDGEKKSVDKSDSPTVPASS